MGKQISHQVDCFRRREEREKEKEKKGQKEQEQEWITWPSFVYLPIGLLLKLTNLLTE